LLPVKPGAAGAAPSLVVVKSAERNFRKQRPGRSGREDPMKRDLLLILLPLVLIGAGPSPTEDGISIRGKEQRLRIYGTRGSPPAVVLSSDGGWIHLAPEVSKFLADQGYFVVGFDVKAYLTSFTTKASKLRPEEVPGDMKVLVDYAARGNPQPPLLLGVSEGAGIAVLAATGDDLKPRILGVIGLGLGDINELGWKFWDALIYVTKKVPREPTFSVAEIIGKASPVPIAAINSSHDGFVPQDEVKRIFEKAGDPSRLWIVEAGDHNFDGNKEEMHRRLLEAIEWVKTKRAEERPAKPGSPETPR
jgi:pimeloyl-ACP methyl ester carboxylesterase